MNEYYVIIGLLSFMIILQMTVIHAFGKLVLQMSGRFNEMFLLISGLKTLDDLIEGLKSGPDLEPVLFEDMGSE
tara:strand:- start:1723 stop:1944 length:222 start_codon:yes stop_codon:yes gene_type:complete